MRGGHHPSKGLRPMYVEELGLQARRQHDYGRGEPWQRLLLQGDRAPCLIHGEVVPRE
jgi:hypothetical protein